MTPGSACHRPVGTKVAKSAGFLNLPEAAKARPVEHFVYASSSSVYGANTKMPFSVEDRGDHSVSLYAATKRANELMAFVYARTFGVSLTGLRFFTVYGPWGRPDMAAMLFARAILAGEPTDVFNHGDMQRGFTDIDDIVTGVVVLDRLPPPERACGTASNNIGSHHPEQLMRFIEVLSAALGRKPRMNLLPMQPGDVQAAYAEDRRGATEAAGVVPRLRRELDRADRRRFLALALAARLQPAFLFAGAANAANRALSAGPRNYRAALRSLRAGDVLRLAAGEYSRGLPLHEVTGTEERPIVIEGPLAPNRAVFLGRAGLHTVSLLDCAHVIVRNLVLDGRGERVDAVRAEGHARFAHHVTLEGLTIVNHGATQQNSGISTKCPAWRWVVRGNTISGAGTGMYFGDSDGSDPFFDSVIESNRIVDPVGYGIQIKHQHGRPGADARADAASTLIRRNVIVKSRPASAPELARPNLLVGHFPLAGPGAQDRYLIYRNLLLDNPSEALFQGEGNIAFYNNLLFNPRGQGMRIQPHNDKPREVAVFNNTVVAAALGIGFIGGEPGHSRLFEHNLVFGDPAMRSDVEGENLSGEFARAQALFARLEADPMRLDLTPQEALPAPRSSIGSEWLSLPDARDDFVGRARTGPAFGACLGA